jgi:hypothetical protein
VTYQAFVYNPSKVRTCARLKRSDIDWPQVRSVGAPFDHGFLDGPGDGIAATTALDKAKKTWVSTMSVPLALFNVDAGQAKGTQWRMNFFRTITSPSTYPNQTLGGWSPPNQASFHMTPYFGYVTFV